MSQSHIEQKEHRVDTWVARPNDAALMEMLTRTQQLGKQAEEMGDKFLSYLYDITAKELSNRIASQEALASRRAQ